MDETKQASKLRLIYLAHSPSTQAVLWLLEELGIEYDITRFERPLDKRVVGLKETHVQGHAPQLILPDGRVITQMSACMLYLLLTYDTEQVFHKTDSEYRIREDYLVSLATADLIARYGLNKLFLDEDVSNALHVMEMELEGRNWMMGGDTPSRADMALKIALDMAVQPNFVEIDKWPRVKAWMERCEARPAWKRSLEKGIGYQLDWNARAREVQHFGWSSWIWPTVALTGAAVLYQVVYGAK